MLRRCAPLARQSALKSRETALSILLSATVLWESRARLAASRRMLQALRPNPKPSALL
jgi:hypothetical protein